MADANRRLAGNAAIATDAGSRATGVGSHGIGRATAMLPVRRGADAAR